MKTEEAKEILKIQQVDQEIDRVKLRIKRIHEEKSDLEKRIDDLQKEEDEIKAKLEDLKRKKKELEDLIREEEEALKKVEDKMYKVTKDFEYKALLREKARHEDNILKASYELDSLVKDLEDFTKSADKRISEIDKTLKDLREELEDLTYEIKASERKLKELELKRKEVTSSLSEGLLQTYELTKDRFDSMVVVPVEDGVCTGCGMRVPDVLYSDMMRTNEIHRCPNCGRYIYYRL